MIIKNSNLRVLLYSNRYKILAVIIAIILILIIIPTLNNIAKEEAISKQENKLTSQNTATSTTHKPEQTVISGGNVSKEKQEENNQIIENFVKLCNQKQIQEAYDLLTDECKEQVFYSNIEYFSKNYVERIFKEEKTFTLQSWVKKADYTYQIKYVTDMLSTGKVDNETLEDYITIVNTTNGYKLNINEYIGRETLNKTEEKENISISLKQKDTYKDYEIYKIQIQNNSEKTILLDSKKTTNTVYLQNDSESKYPALMYEVDDTKLIIEGGKSKQIEIKFNKTYANTTQIQYLMFTDIIKDYEAYKNMENKDQYTDILKMAIEL